MKKLIPVVLAILFMTSSVSMVLAKPATTSPATAAAIKLYKAGNYTQSYMQFTDLVKKDPSNALAYYYLAMSSVQLGKKDEAISNYERVIEMSPNGILGSYAKQGIRCTDDPIGCHEPVKEESTVTNNDSEEDKFIKGKFGSGFSINARGAYEKQKIENIKREINRNNDITPQTFKDYKDFSSYEPTNEEIANAIQTLRKAGFNDILGSQNYGNDVSYLLGAQDNTNKSGYEMLNMLFNNGRSGTANLNPQVIQSLLSTQMTASF